MILWKYSLREIRNRPGRAILTLLSVVIGVAAVVAVSIATKNTRRAYQEMFQTISGRADLEIVAEGGGSFDERIVALAEGTAGVETAVPSVHRYTILYARGRRTKLMALGIDPARDRAVRDYQVTAGRELNEGTGILLEAGFARRLGVQLGEEVKLLTRVGLVRAQVIGLFEPRGAAAIAQGGLVFMSLKRAQSRFQAKQRVDAVSVVLEATADQESVMAEVSKKLPTGLSVRRPVIRTQMADETLLAAEQGMNLATAFSLLVAVFIIMNTFLMNVGERRRQLAMMRAIGATRRQVAWLLYHEALAMGVVGTVLGILVGLAGAYGLSRAMGRLMLQNLPPIEIAAVPVWRAIAFGLGVSLLGAYVPARRAGKLTPQEGMGAVVTRDSERLPLWVTLLGLGTLLVTAALLVACIAGWLPIEVSVTSSVFALVGMVFLIPQVLAPVSRLIGALFFRWMPVEGRLARRQLLRHRARTTLTIGVLFVAISTGVGLANSVIDNVYDVRDWYNKAIVGDFFVRAMMPDMATGAAPAVPEGVREEIAKIPGLTDLDAVRLVSARAAGQSVTVAAREFHRDEQVYFDLTTGEPATMRQRLLQGDVVIGTVLAQRAGLTAGDELPMETREGPRRLRIAGTANDYLGGGLTVYMHSDTARRLLGVEGVDAFVVKADAGALAAVEAALESICATHGLLLQSYADLVRLIDGMMAGVVGSLWGLLVLGLVVASFGVVNTLTMNVLEQTRELGILRVVAMTRWQVRKSIFAQAAMMGLIGLMPGIVAGVAVAYFMNLATLPVTGHPVAFVFRPLLLIGALALALVIVLAAAWAPAERAARLQLTEALRYE